MHFPSKWWSRRKESAQKSIATEGVKFGENLYIEGDIDTILPLLAIF